MHNTHSNPLNSIHLVELTQNSSLEQWLKWLEVNQPSHHIKLGLQQVNKVWQQLQITQPFNSDKLCIITVGGTNGKGSTCTFLEHILHAAHYKTAVYSSPHLLDFCERLRIGTQQSNPEQWTWAFNLVLQASQQIQTQLTYFEFVTLAAFCIASDLQRTQNLDVLIVEVGMGGRLDATNLLDANCSIITSIDLDHQAYLGDTRQAIALEKAGILRKNSPAICGDLNPPQSLIDYAQSNQIPLFYLGQQFGYQTHSDQWQFFIKTDHQIEQKNEDNQTHRVAMPVFAQAIYSQPEQLKPSLTNLDNLKKLENSANFEPAKTSQAASSTVDAQNITAALTIDRAVRSMPYPSLKGQHQLNNASCAIAALMCLPQIAISTQDIKRGLTTAELAGRMQISAGQPCIVLDVAHNTEGVSMLAKNLDQMGFYGKNYAVFSALADKDIKSMLISCKHLIDEWHIAPLDVPRGLDIQGLVQQLELAGISRKHIHTYPSIAHAYAFVKKQMQSTERLVVFGSFYTVASALNYDNTKTLPNIAIKSYAKRLGRITNLQEDALNTHQQYLIAFNKQQLLPIKQNNQATVLEIGFGMGHTTAHIANYMPNTQFIGVEVHTPGVGSLLHQIHQQTIQNLRIIMHDAVEVLQFMVEDASLEGVHIFFPDPWHKAKHHKRRLIQTPFVELLIKKLKVGGYIHCATDWQPYAEHILETLAGQSHLQNTAQPGQYYIEKPAYRPTTKFEQRGIKLGHGVWDILFKKIV